MIIVFLKEENIKPYVIFNNEPMLNNTKHWLKSSKYDIPNTSTLI